MPHSVDNARNVEDVEGIAINQVFVGSCTGGKRQDIEVLAKTLAGKKIAAPSTRLVVTMATRGVVKESLDKGYYQALLECRRLYHFAGCGGCSGLLGGVTRPMKRGALRPPTAISLVGWGAASRQRFISRRP